MPAVNHLEYLRNDRTGPVRIGRTKISEEPAARSYYKSTPGGMQRTAYICIRLQVLMPHCIANSMLIPRGGGGAPDDDGHQQQVTKLKLNFYRWTNHVTAFLQHSGRLFIVTVASCNAEDVNVQKFEMKGSKTVCKWSYEVCSKNTWTVWIARLKLVSEESAWWG